MQMRLDALEDGVDEDAMAVGDDDDEFELEDEGEEDLLRVPSSPTAPRSRTCSLCSMQCTMAPASLSREDTVGQLDACVSRLPIEMK